MCDNATYTHSYTHAKRFKIRANSEILWCVVVLGLCLKYNNIPQGKVRYKEGCEIYKKIT